VGVLRKEEFGKLMNLTGGLGVLTRLISPILSYEMFVSSVTSRKSNPNIGPVLPGLDVRIPSASDAE
jgi:hypothetical protein